MGHLNTGLLKISYSGASIIQIPFHDNQLLDLPISLPRHPHLISRTLTDKFYKFSRDMKSGLVQISDPHCSPPSYLTIQILNY